VTSPVSESDALKRELRMARVRAIGETFGGPNMYALLKERNPQIDLILNAGIMAGLQQTSSGEE
jgi:hypothetical protein